MKIANIPRISVERLHEKILEGNAPILVDVLSEEQYLKNHIEGSVNICVYDLSFIKHIMEQFPDKNSVIVCYGYDNSEFDASSAVEKLVINDYQNVFVLKNGIEGWLKHGLTLKGTDGKLSSPDEFISYDEGRYSVDTERSSLFWIGRNADFEHSGTVKIKKGLLKLTSDEATGFVVVDMTTIKNTSLQEGNLKKMLIDHLFSEDFFFVKLFNEATFYIKSVTLNRTVLSAPNSIIKGFLEMRGVKKNMQFTATLSNTSQDGILTVNTHIFVDRTEWGAIYGSSRYFKFLGKHLVYDGVTIELRLVLNKILD